MGTARRQSEDVSWSDVPVEALRPGHIIGASGARVVISAGFDHGTYWSYVVRYTNGVVLIESWDYGSTVRVVGFDRGVSHAESRLRAVAQP